MVKSNSYTLWVICVVALCTGFANQARCSQTEVEYIAQSISADACDDRLVDDDEHTAENRAVDKAGLSAVKLSGIIQRSHPDLSASAIDIISYRIIDEYMVNVAHAIKYSDGNRVCVKLMADIEMTASDLEKLVKEYKDSDSPVEQMGEAVKVAQVAEQVNKNTTVKPQSLDDKKLLYIRKMIFWNGVETNHYNDLLTGLFSGSDYFYVTDDESLADFVVTPRLVKSQVDEIDSKNHKMSMVVELEVYSPTNNSFAPINERQNHFILFASDKDEQKIADDMLRKLLTKSVKEASRKIDKYSAVNLEKAKIR